MQDLRSIMCGCFVVMRGFSSCGYMGSRALGLSSCGAWAYLLLSMGFPGSSAGKESPCNAGDLGLIPELGRSPGEGHSNPLRDSCLENPHEQRSLPGYCPWGLKESDMTERLKHSTGGLRASQGALVVKNPLANAGEAREVGLIPGSEGSPGGGNGNSSIFAWRIP